MAKRRMMAALAAVATLACGLAGPAAQANELSDLKEAAAQARNAYDEAVSERDALKPARDKAQAVLDEGTIGYFIQGARCDGCGEDSERRRHPDRTRLRERH